MPVEERMCAASLTALDRALDEVAAVVSTLSPEAYRARPLPDVSGSIGEHVRHCLGHLGERAIESGQRHGAHPLFHRHGTIQGDHHASSK